MTVVNSADIARRSKASLYGRKLISFLLIPWAPLALQRARPCVSGEAPAFEHRGSVQRTHEAAAWLSLHSLAVNR